MKRDWLFGLLSRSLAPVLGLALAVAGCGGVDSGGTGGSSAVGPVSGLGSIVVNGVRFDDSAALITDDDGASVARSRLKLGVLVAVDGSAVTPSGSERLATASRVRISSDLIGPVGVVDRQLRGITVLQQPVRVTAATVFDDLLPLGLDSVVQGMTIEVYGRVDSTTGQYVATRIELRAAPAYHMIRGRIDAVDAGGSGTARIGAAVLDVSALPAAERSLVVVGRTVRIRLEPGSWRAVSAATSARTLSDSQEGFLEGRITAFDSVTSFEVDGQAVDATRASFPQGTAAPGLGVRVSIEGVSRNGVLVATSVRLEDDEDATPSVFELHGAIESLDAVARQLQIKGVAVDYSGSVSFTNGSASDLILGRQIEVKGTLQGDGVGLRAQEIKFESN